ncbi:MAG: lytic transglycosylase domain-containing protein [Clostridium sp.]|uniref:lytic transglycosylase domain-containing protein n=1 Tax=Clostridium sp. TaxID=1506 RepID=UPI00306A8430
MAHKRNAKNKRIILTLFIVVIIIVSFKGILRNFFPLEYKEYIIQYSKEYDLDPNLVAAVINTESKFSVEAKSSKGALGLMQIMPDTGIWIGETMGIENFNADMINDPLINIKMGCWYLNKLSNDFSGEYNLILAAYNAGPGNVTKWLNDEKYSEDGKSLLDIPFKETKNYVKKVSFGDKMYRYLYKLE